MTSNYGNNIGDPIVEILHGDPDENDIQVIDRDNNNNSIDSFNNNVETPSVNGPQFYDNQEEQLGQNGYNKAQKQGTNDSLGYSPFDPTLSFGTPSLSNQLATITQPKYMSPTIPMAPLSESALHGRLGIQPLSLQASSIPNFNTTELANRPVAPKKKKESTGPKTRPQFVMKMWSMVNDPDNKEYIRWNDDGKTFQVFHREEFMKAILPKYFKHNNFTSFVRQLNMYGWHKVQDINSGALNPAKDDKNEVWRFENPYFIRDREDLLDKIVRNKSVNQDLGQNDANQVNFTLLLNELEQIKRNQLAIGEDLRRVRKDNKTLWQENYITRERHQQQATTLDKILKFLAAVYGNNAGKILEVDNTPFDINDLSNNQMTTYNYQQNNQNNQNNHQPQPTMNSYAQQPLSPYFKPRLMLMNKAHGNSPTSSKNSSSVGLHKGSENSGSGSIEEIIRSYENTPSFNSNSDPNNNNNSADATNNANRIYQQIINQEPAISSPRHFFPELNSNVPSPYPEESTPGNYAKIASPVDPYLSHSNDAMNGLEQNIYKQGQSIQQVQDWIQKLANQQQQQQQQQQLTLSSLYKNEDVKSDISEFDVDDFLNNTNLNISNPIVLTPELNSSKQGTKRSLEEYGSNTEQPQNKRSK